MQRNWSAHTAWDVTIIRKQLDSATAKDLETLERQMWTVHSLHHVELWLASRGEHRRSQMRLSRPPTTHRH